MWFIIFVIAGTVGCMYLAWKLMSNTNTPTSLPVPTEKTPLLSRRVAEDGTSQSNDHYCQGDSVALAFSMPDFDIVGLPKISRQARNGENKEEEEYIEVDVQDPDFMAAKQDDDYMSEQEIQFLISAVKYSRLMSSIKDENMLRDVVKTMTKKHVKNGDVVIQQGDTNGRSYYVMESGAVDVFVFDQFRVTIQPGWCFGELSFVFGAPRSASCIASSDSNTTTVLWVLDRAQFDRVMSGQAPLERMRITRQDSDPMRNDDEEELTKRALTQIYGTDFLHDEGVRLLSKEFLEQLLERDYIGVPEQINRALQAFRHLDSDLKYNLRTNQLLPL